MGEQGLIRLVPLDAVAARAGRAFALVLHVAAACLLGGCGNSLNNVSDGEFAATESKPVRAREVRLGPTEFRLLAFFMENAGRVLSRQQLLDGVWGRDAFIDGRTVDVHIGRLRKALIRGADHDPIRTVRGAGYAFESDAL